MVWLPTHYGHFIFGALMLVRPLKYRVSKKVPLFRLSFSHFARCDWITVEVGV